MSDGSDVLRREIRERRVERHLTQDDLAKLAGLKVDTLRAVTQGKIRRPGIFVVADIARALGASIDSLVGGAMDEG